MSNIIALIIAYLIGSLSSALLLSKLLKFPDPRTQGSGNAGATNVLRNVGKKEGAMVLAGDVLKGVIAVLLARFIGVQGVMLGFVALAATVGHIFPVFFKFKGGKGVAPALGTVIVLCYWSALIMIIAWGITAAIFRYASLASIVAVIVAPIAMLITGHSHYAFPIFIMAALIIWKHMDNINRLRDGTESKIEF